ncbi:gliding motility lipoprotein GldB [Membranihabitans marinus]|uniref:gliding motility lipoprotein GldB n=1 Tax=Membranihabitans marinus TaxID=1227546 RepID=UPI001F37A410|nr:hypothetical protein [Membranihabitans marinus]
MKKRFIKYFSIPVRPRSYSVLAWTMVGIIIVGLYSCNTLDEDEGLDIEAEKIEIIAYDQLICGTGEDMATGKTLSEEHPEFTDIFFNQILFPRQPFAIPLDTLMKEYCRSGAIQHLMDTTAILYPNTDFIAEELGLAFGYYKHYFPEKSIPKVYTFVSEFSIGSFTIDDEIIGIGLDFYLGENYPYYDPSVFPLFVRSTMSREYITPQAIMALLEYLTPPVKGNTLLDYMIRNGKIIYLLKKLMPFKSDHSLFLYTPEQLDWVEDNELEIWQFFLDNELLYEQDSRKFAKYVDRAPNSPGMPAEAPGRTANFIGYKIVEKYMSSKNSDDIQSLLDLESGQKILSESNYKPPRR